MKKPTKLWNQAALQWKTYRVPSPRIVPKPVSYYSLHVPPPSKCPHGYWDRTCQTCFPGVFEAALDSMPESTPEEIAAKADAILGQMAAGIISMNNTNMWLATEESEGEMPAPPPDREQFGQFSTPSLWDEDEASERWRSQLTETLPKLSERLCVFCRKPGVHECPGGHVSASYMTARARIEGDRGLGRQTAMDVFPGQVNADYLFAIPGYGYDD